MRSEKLSFRPYARLLTMLGDQLIKNEQIALVELIKNAYDADATRVEVRFENFDENMKHKACSRIVVRDDGTGMTPETVRTQWMNPAAPRKYLDKRDGTGKTPVKKRVIQGEKGIGRFAVLKLGKVVTITTRTEGADFETVLACDFSRFDDDFVIENDQPKEIFLDQITINCSQSEPVVLPGADYGTVIVIESLKGVWTDDIVAHLCRDVSNLTDPVSRITGGQVSDCFEIAIFCNGTRRSVETDSMETLKSLIEDKPVLNIHGTFHSGKNTFSFETRTAENEISLQDSKITGLWVWRQRFGRAGVAADQKYACGRFEFKFHIFDFSRGIDGRHVLTQPEKNLLKEHRIYLYRDGMRVYPYGDPDDDWLRIDVTRGTGRAGNFFSNDQIIGWIHITQKDNPGLRDKTNREGLIETGGAAHDLIFLVQTFLSYVKQYPYFRYQRKQQQRSTARFVRDGVIAQDLADLKKGLEEAGFASQSRRVQKIAVEYGQEREYLSRRAEMTEDLAGVGLSVEMASHDVMLLISRAQDIGKRLAQGARTSGDSEVQEQVDMLIGVLQQITDGMQEVQSLFKSSRRRRKILRIERELDRIHRIYQTLLEQRSIRYQKIKVGASPLVASTTDGVVMQVLINLFDNASYWLETVPVGAREIRVTVNGDHEEMVFSDSGPGIDPEDLPYIFEPFYSGKGEEGRGLGLYIARQLLERYGYRISVAEKRQRVLSGANFLVSFVKDDD